MRPASTRGFAAAEDPSLHSLQAVLGWTLGVAYTLLAWRLLLNI